MTYITGGSSQEEPNELNHELMICLLRKAGTYPPCSLMYFSIKDNYCISILV